MPDVYKPYISLMHFAGCCLKFEIFVYSLFFSEGFLFVLGGQDDNKVTLNSGEKYDPDTNSWSPLTPMNEVSLLPFRASVI